MKTLLMAAFMSLTFGSGISYACDTAAVESAQSLLEKAKILLNRGGLFII